MRRINLNQAAPWPALRWVVGSAALWCAAAALVAIPVWRQQAVASATHQRQQRTDSYRAESAARLEQTMLSQLRELAEATDGDVPMTKALQTLQDQVKRQLEQLAKPGHSDRETLATLSQIHRAVSETRASMDADVAARSLKTLANVLASAESLEAVNVAVEEEDFAEAAHRLSEWNPQRLSELERQTLVDQLNPVAATVKKTGEKKLAEATEQLRDGLAQRDDQRAAAASRTIAQQMSRQALRMKIQQTLDRQLTQLAEAKGLGRSGGDDTTPSDQSRETWGRGRDGEPLGDESERLATTRQRKTLSGTLGEGPANRQQMAANQLDGDVERDYQSIPQRKFDEVEQVLREEALPIGHRQTIRNYFQTLREHTE